MFKKQLSSNNVCLWDEEYLYFTFSPKLFCCLVSISQIKSGAYPACWILGRQSAIFCVKFFHPHASQASFFFPNTCFWVLKFEKYLWGLNSRIWTIHRYISNDASTPHFFFQLLHKRLVHIYTNLSLCFFLSVKLVCSNLYSCD